MGGDAPATSRRFPACRSILFVPGDRPDRYAKALGAGADAICIDLEDAVAPTRKAEARDSVARFLADPPMLSSPGAGPLRRAGESRMPAPSIVVRVNDPQSTDGERDAAALAGRHRPDAFMIPKATTPGGIQSAQRLLGADIPLLPIVETALGLEHAARIAAATPRVAALIFGGFDLSVELGAEPEWGPLLYARSRVVHAAALGGIDAIDMPSRDLRETVELRSEAERARHLGFAGKVAIHPKQIPVIHEVFTPSEQEVARARRIVEADRAAGGGAVALDGRMVDRPVVAAARRILARGSRP